LTHPRIVITIIISSSNSSSSSSSGCCNNSCNVSNSITFMQDIYNYTRILEKIMFLDYTLLQLFLRYYYYYFFFTIIIIIRFIIIIIIILIITFMQDIYNFMNETNHISTVHSFAAIQYTLLHFVLHVMLCRT